jgi:hypothetical protein
MAAAATLSLSMASAAFAEGSTLPTLVDDTKKNAGVQLIYEVRLLRAPGRAAAAAGAPARSLSLAVRARARRRLRASRPHAPPL